MVWLVILICLTMISFVLISYLREVRERDRLIELAKAYREDLAHCTSIYSLLTIHVKAWESGIKTEKLSYGRNFRRKDIENLTVYDIYLQGKCLADYDSLPESFKSRMFDEYYLILAQGLSITGNETFIRS